MIISFSHIVDCKRVPLLDELSREVTLSVEASTKTEAINSEDVKDFCAERSDDTRPRRVM